MRRLGSSRALLLALAAAARAYRLPAPSPAGLAGIGLRWRRHLPPVATATEPPGAQTAVERQWKEAAWQQWRQQQRAPGRLLPRIDVGRHGEARAPWRLPPAHRALLAQMLVAVAQTDGSAASARKVWDAFVFSLRYHRGQFRQSGEPYATHPLEVAAMLAQQGADLPTVMTGLLHDTVEDTGATLQQITGRFGPEVRAAALCLCLSPLL